VAGRTPYSAPLLVQKGVQGAGTPVTVPSGFVYVVKMVASYAAPVFNDVNVAFHHDTADTILWIVKHSLFGHSSEWAAPLFFVFNPGEAFSFHVGSSGTDAADVYAGGYVLTIPAGP